MSSPVRQTSISPVAIISFVIITVYCGGFVRVELKFHNHDRRIEALEAILAQEGYSAQHVYVQFVPSAGK